MRKALLMEEELVFDFFPLQLISVYVGSMLLSGKHYCAEVYPEMDVWSYEDLAYASFGLIGRVSCRGYAAGDLLLQYT